ncbi:hypothetical protein TRFO_35660 [Tritrichomonas foetus]|uniref:VPS9 domain-containing protein n=1 Tax=Tritrichomonas foetus TaxID=1144522 RepID=A0A1J4JFT6_9EUKA|nr:hypothetical protein TRFO_35660 [Tritrichomonas foetus]|eukprot:OHS98018.1 hypothetical protein TRFO_35660 [Tritrichomonas foetus]
MQNWSLDSHPILNKFRHLADHIKPDPNCYYHLFLTPPYAHPIDKNFDPAMYLYFSKESEENILHQYKNPNVTFEIHGDQIKSQNGFNCEFTLHILMSNLCTGINSFSYTLDELDDDIYRHVPKPANMKKIQEIFKSGKDAKLSRAFLNDINDPELNEALSQIEHCFFTAEINETNRKDFADILKNYISTVSSIVFDLPQFKQLPVATKRELNYLIFNAITEQCHYQLLLSYNSSFTKENLIAQENTRNYTGTSLSNSPSNSPSLKKEEMESAVRHLHGILHLPSPSEMIDCIVKFFDRVVAALPGVEVAADDILPAICFAMTRDVGFGSHVVSFFNYLSDIWPSCGLDDRVTYILVTCSIAASHLSIKQKKPKQPQPSQVTAPEPMNKQTEETIGLLEDLLSLV